MLRISLLGSFRVELDGKLIEENAWARRKVKSLLKLLALQPGYRLHKDQALDLLWSDLDPVAASGNLYRNLHLLRQALEPGLNRKAEANIVIFKGEILRLNPAAGLWVDVDAFQSLLARSRSQQDPLALLEEAASLYRGDLLEEDPYEEWTLLRREELRRDFHQTLLTLAALYRQRNAFAAAMTVLQRILSNDPTNESAHRELILTYTLAGQRNEALTQYQVCTKVIENELGLDPSPETQELYQQVLAGEIRAGSAVVESGGAIGEVSPTMAAAPFNTRVYFDNPPAPLTSLVGREAEVSRIVTLLKRPETRLLTLIGPAGVGKTRLSLETATTLIKEKAFENGVCFVPLAALNDPDLLPLAIAQATGIREAGNQPLMVLLKHFLRELDLLLVLDNFEQLTRGAGILSELLNACPRLKILVSSRSVLHVYGEQEFVIQPLALPPSRLFQTFDQIKRSPAVTLFVQRAQAVNSNFELTGENKNAVAEICHQLDGLPLAIELVAAQVKVLTPSHILSRLKNWLHLVHNTARDLPSRQQTLQNALDWSYDLLSPEEQRLFAWLGVFEQGCDLETLEAVCFNSTATGPIPASLEMLNKLAELIDKSLLYRQEVALPPLSDGDHREDTRYCMLEVIHRYALQRLTMSGEEAMLREYHLNYFLKLVEAVEPKMHGQDLSSWLIRLEAEHENLRAALNWALAAEAGDPVRIEKGVRLAGALAWFWHYRGYWSEGTVWVDKALDWANRLILPSSVKAKALYAAGWMNIGQGNLVRAKACLEESLVLYREINDKWGITHSLDALGELARQRGDYATARPLYETGLELCHELEDQFCAHYQLIGLGFISSEQQDYQGAAKLFGEGLSSCRELGDRYGAARALNGMGELQRRQGNLEQAVAYYEQSLALYQELAHTGNVIAVLYNLGQVELERMDYEKAATHFKYSLVLAYEIKSKRLVGWCLAGLAGVALGQEAFEYSANLFGAAEIVLETIGAHLDPVNQPAYERAVAKLRRQLDEASLKMAWAEGRAMLLEQVISNVLDQQVLALTHA